MFVCLAYSSETIVDMRTISPVLSKRMFAIRFGFSLVDCAAITRYENHLTRRCSQLKIKRNKSAHSTVLALIIVGHTVSQFIASDYTHTHAQHNRREYDDGDDGFAIY